MTRLDGFNNIAHAYDYLKRFVFGSEILRSENRFLTELPAAGNILVLGGGSGEILDTLLKHSPARRIWYVDASSVMLRRASRNVAVEDRARVEFVHGTEASIPPTVMFDGAVTHFFLDLFTPEQLSRICDRIDRQLASGGIWLVSDFVPSDRAWHRVLLWLMYRFFGATSGITARKLPNWQDQLSALALARVAEAAFYGGFIQSTVYRKPASTA